MSGTKEYKLTAEQRELTLEARYIIGGLCHAADIKEKKLREELKVPEDSEAHDWLTDLLYNTVKDSNPADIEKLMHYFETAMREEAKNGNV